MSLLRVPDVRARTGLSRTTIWRLVNAAEFPQPVRVGSRWMAWPETEINGWIAARQEARPMS